jgi:hypothetical protein
MKIKVNNNSESGLEYKSTFHPMFWEGEEFKKDIRQKLLEIANRFINDLGVEGITPDDITLTGSLANYNWSDKSDIDLHIIIDFDKLKVNNDILKDLLNLKRMMWNKAHDIKIKGHDVEIYIQDKNEPHYSTGVYSLNQGEWIDKPSREEPKLDLEAAQNKAEQISKDVDNLERFEAEKKYEMSISLKDKIKKMRQIGLESDGVYSVENLAFKLLRRSGALDKLSDANNNAYDEMYSIDEKKKKKQQKGKKRARKVAKRKTKKKKDDRCTRIAKRKYDVWPSAYASGAVVKCRQGKIWKGVKEELDLTNSEVDTLKKIKIQLKKSAEKHAKVAKMSTDSSNLHKKQVDQIDDLIDEKKKKAKTDYSKEKKSGLHGWFSRQGGKGKSKGWVDCNTCRKDKKSGRKKCKPCGRKKGEKRSKYPACRPTPASCGTRGKGKKWGKKSGKTNESVNRIYKMFIDQELKPG